MIPSEWRVKPGDFVQRNQFLAYAYDYGDVEGVPDHSPLLNKKEATSRFWSIHETAVVIYVNSPEANCCLVYVASTGYLWVPIAGLTHV